MGLTVPALYYHFGSKLGILRALIEEHLREREDLMTARLSGASRHGRAPERILDDGLRAYVYFMADERGMAWVMLRDARLLAEEGLFDLVRASEARIAELLAEVLAEGMEAGSFRRSDPLLTAHLLLAAARCALLSRAVADLGHGHGPTAEAVLELLLEGVLARKASP
ncbi:MAG: hypothetical protein Kow00129_05850 [Thermoleophilia bacterium]